MTDGNYITEDMIQSLIIMGCKSVTALWKDLSHGYGGPGDAYFVVIWRVRSCTVRIADRDEIEGVVKASQTPPEIIHALRDVADDPSGDLDGVVHIIWNEKQSTVIRVVLVGTEHFENVTVQSKDLN